MGKTIVYLIHGIGVKNAEWWGNTKDIIESKLKENHNDIEVRYLTYDTAKFDVLDSVKNLLGGGKTLATLDDIGRNLISQLYADDSLI